MSIFSDLKLLFEIRPYIGKIKEISAMKLSTQMVLQVLALAVQAYNQFGGLITNPNYKSMAALGIGIIQLVMGYVAHLSDPVTGIMLPRRKD